MFCQHCGVEVTHDLNYCTRCGGSLGQPGSQEPAPRAPVSAMSVWGVGVTTLFLVLGGLGILFGCIFGLAMESRVPAPALVFIALFGTLTLLGSVALLMRLWRFLLAGPHTQTPSHPARLSRPSTSGELPPPRASALPEAFGHVPSVTEHTTRTFDPAYREPRRR